MASQFYSTIVEEEKERFNLGRKSLKAAALSISACYWKKSLGKQALPLDYKKPSNRCAYLYKFATINTGLVTKYFRKLVRKRRGKDALYFQKSIHVCCLGGGPGTDIFGIFRALAVIPSFQKKITEVSILDICGGWASMFNNIMKSLLDGNVDDIPDTFINQNKFKHEFIEVDLLDPLPLNVMEIISSADIVCMSRFASDILGDERSSNALKVLGSLFKLGALILYVDTFNEQVFELSENISKDNGLEIVLGPLHEKFFRPSVSEKDVYGCNPQMVAKFSIVGWHKTSASLSIDDVYNESYLTINNSDEESEDLSIAIDISDSEENYEFLIEPIPSICHKYTQTESNMPLHGVSSEDENLEALIKAVGNLLNVTEQWKQKYFHRKCNCHQ